MSNSNFHKDLRFDPRDYDTRRPGTEAWSHEEETVPNNSMPSRITSRSGYMSPRNSSRSSSILTNPSSPAPRPGLHSYTGEKHTALQDVPPLSLNKNGGRTMFGGSSPYAPRSELPFRMKTPPTRPVAERQQERKPGWTHPLPGDPSLPLAVVNSGAPTITQQPSVRGLSTSTAPFGRRVEKPPQAAPSIAASPFPEYVAKTSSLPYPGRRKAASDTEDEDEEAEQRVQHLRRAEMIDKVEAIVEQSKGMTPERRLVFAANVEKMKMKRSPYVRQLEAIRRKFDRALHEENAKDLLKASTVSEGMATAGNAVVAITVPVVAEKSEVKTSTVSNTEISASVSGSATQLLCNVLTAPACAA